MRHAPSQQGRTPSQHPGLTPQASTPFSHAQAALSPHGGHRSSPQHFKKSPAAAKNSPATMGTSGTIGTSTATLTNMPTNPPVGFDSPSAAALGALAMNEINLDSLSMTGLVPPPASNGGRADEDEQKRRLDDIIKILWVSTGGSEELPKPCLPC